jgi:hypothetical protein
MYIVWLVKMLWCFISYSFSCNKAQLQEKQIMKYAVSNKDVCYQLVKIKVKVKLSLCNGDVCIHNLHTISILSPLDRQLDGPQSQYGLAGKNKSLCATLESTPSPSYCLLTKSTDLHSLLLSADESKEWFNLSGFITQRSC